MQWAKTNEHNMTKLALIGASVISMGALTASNSTTANQANDHQRMIERTSW